MNMKYALYATMLFFSFGSFSTDIYDASTIKETLKKNADVVYRIDHGEFEIKDIDKAFYSKKEVYTVLNEEGDDYAQILLPYDDFSKITSLNVAVYNRRGESIQKYSKRDFEDYSEFYRSDLYNENRILFLDARQKDYPYTISLEYSIKYKYLYSINDWYTQSGYNVSVEHSSYKVIIPHENPLNYKSINTDIMPLIEEDNENKIYKWDFKNLPALEKESFSLGISELVAVIQLNPTKFKYDDYEGELYDWNGFAKWQNDLNQGLNDLDETTKDEIRSLTEGLSDREKIKTVYKYMQNRSRYVSIQLGIGGMKPYSAATVHNSGYGDCKGLSFYTKCLLEAVGITAYYSWINAGDNPPKINPDFPNDDFNHIILNIPLQNDTVWLECTSRDLPAGYLGSFTNDRYALVMLKDSAKLIKTPDYGLNENKITIDNKILFDENGNATLEFKSEHYGLGTEYKSIRSAANLETYQKEKWLKRFFPFSDIHINEYDFTKVEDSIPYISLEASMQVRNIGKKLGNNYLINPNDILKLGIKVREEKNRTSPIAFKSNYAFEIVSELVLPNNFKVGEIPDPKHFENQFGSFSLIYEPSDNGVKLKKTYLPTTGVFPATDYEDLWKFFTELRAYESERLILVRKD